LTIPGLLYPDASDALQQMIPGLVAVLMFGLAMLPSIIVTAVGVSLQSHAITVGLLIVVNAAVTWGAVCIAGSLYDRFDPTSD
jgi:hypothetical protein